MPRPASLSYTLNKKTDKLLKAYKNKSTGIVIMSVTGAAAGILWMYLLGNMEHYLGGWSSLYTGNLSPTDLLTPMEGVFLKILLLVTLAFGAAYALWNKHNEKYKKIKKEILEILELGPCIHKSYCNCKDEYCEWLEREKGVDLL